MDNTTQTLDFTTYASGAYGAFSADGTRFYTVDRLTKTRWVMAASYVGQRPYLTEEAKNMTTAKVMANVRALADQGLLDEALALKATIS